ncbi:unnamed protein product [Ceutorhynchus assimilis]|uniref:Uncharacterized protein n=1 Tax=Ceutorhynchus assimilis TaxID=467358 RepID=A0A9N9QS06_9CUCU|nr:unnamed protein product [Ceutorhynchus assimilis]
MKFFATLFIALVAVHASTQSPVEKTSKAAKFVAEIVDVIVAETEKLLEPVNAWADQLDSNKDNYEHLLVNVLTALSVAINDKVTATVQEASAGASESGKAIIDCLVAEESNVDVLMNTILEKIIDCEFEIYDNATDLVKNVLKQVAETQTNFKALSTALVECTAGDFLCLAFFSQNVVLQLQASIVNAVSDIAVLNSLAFSAVEVTKQCHVVEVLEKDAASVLDNIANCLYNGQ